MRTPRSFASGGYGARTSRLSLGGLERDAKLAGFGGGGYRPAWAQVGRPMRRSASCEAVCWRGSAPDQSAAVRDLITRTVAPGTIAPAGSMTCPESDPTPTWADAIPPARAKTEMAR